MNYKLGLGVLILLLIVIFIHNKLTVEKFYNILPTELIDKEYYNINEDPLNYYNKLRVGDPYGVDLMCNNVKMIDVLKWIQFNDENTLFQYVYKFDPSINVYNPIDTPRVLKLLLQNLPEQHPYLPIIKRCFPNKVVIA